MGCSIKLCPECGGLVTFSIYFGGYSCECGWEDFSFHEKRLKWRGI